MGIFDRIYWKITNKEYNRGVDVGRYLLARHLGVIVAEYERGNITKKKALDEITFVLEAINVSN